MPGGGEKSVKAVLRIWEGCQRGLHDIRVGINIKRKMAPRWIYFRFICKGGLL